MHKLSRSSVALTAMTSTLVLSVTAATTTAGEAAPSTSGGDPSSQRVLAGVQAPFQIARRGSTVYYADGGETVNKIFKITRRGPRVVASVPFVSGVEFSRNRKVMAIAHGGGGAPAAARVTLRRHGKVTAVAEVAQYEKNVNPDKFQTYGLLTPASAECKTQITAATHGAPPTYKGAVDSHPYQLAPLAGGAFALADAGVNGILRIGPKGRISTIAVLPPQPITFSAAQATSFGAPACAGETYATEPVPTDVEWAKGALWVTTLPGGDESGALGARGSVYRIKRGVVTKVAGGFAGATNLAVVRGRFYVTELFAGKITKFGRGGRFTYLNIANPVSIEATRTHLFLGTGVFGPGQVARIRR